MKAIYERVLHHFDKMNVSSSVPGPMDECRIKGTLKFLKKEGCELPQQELTSWALSKNWNPGFTKKVTEWLLKINMGGRVVIKDKQYGVSEKLKAEVLLLKKELL